MGFSTVTKTSVGPLRAGTPPRTTTVFVPRMRVMNGSPRPVTQVDSTSRYDVGGSSCTVHGFPGRDGSTRTCTHPSCMENAETGASYQFPAGRSISWDG